MRIGMSTYLFKLYSLSALVISRRKCDYRQHDSLSLWYMRERLTPLSGQNAFLQGVAKIKIWNVSKAVRALCFPAVCRKTIRDYGEKRKKTPSLDMNNTEQISLKVGALPHSTLSRVENPVYCESFAWNTPQPEKFGIFTNESRRRFLRMNSRNSFPRGPAQRPEATRSTHQ